MNALDDVQHEIVISVVARLYGTEDPDEIRTILRRLANAMESLIVLSLLPADERGDLGDGLAEEIRVFADALSRECLARAGSPGCGTSSLRTIRGER